MINSDAKKDLEGLFCLIVIYAYMIFHSFFSGIGIKSQSGFLELYSVVIFLISVIMFFLFVVRKRYITGTEFIILLSIVYILVNYFIVDAFYGKNDTAYGTLLDFIVRAIPAILIAIVAVRNDLLKNISKTSTVILIFFTFCATKILFLSIIHGYSTKMWDTVFYNNYQNISYTASYAVGIGAYKLFIEDKKKTALTKLIFAYSIAVNVAVALYSGGRGGVVVAVVYLIAVLAYYAFILRKAEKVLKIIIALLVFLLLFGQFLFSNSAFINGLSRAFEFISPSGGINWDGTSGRLSIYQGCINAIIERPVFGYGITGAPRIGIERTHNIFLDILIDGGIIFLIVWVVVIAKAFFYCIKKMKTDCRYVLISFVFIGEFLMLNFSSVYMRNSAIWFALCFLLVDQKYNYYREE